MSNRLFSVLVLFALSIAGPATAESVVRISTDDGKGLDASISRQSPDESSVADGQLMLQYTPQRDESQKIYLRFDLAPVAGKRVKKAILTLQPISGYHGRYDFNVFGLKEADAASGDLTWNNAAGNQRDSGGGYWEVRTDQTTADDGTVVTEQTIVGAGGLDPDQTTYLGRISVRPRKNQCRLFSDELAAFIGSRSGGTATIVLTRATPNATAMAFASSEHPIFDGPQLTLQVSPVVSVLGPVMTIYRHPVTIADEESHVDLQWAAAELKAIRQDWADAVEDVDAMAEALKAEAPADTDRAVAASLGRLLQNEAAYRAMELTDEEWRDAFVTELRRHPRRSGDLFYAFMAIASWRYHGDPERDMEVIKCEPLLTADLPAAARSAIVEWVVDVEDIPKNRDAASRMAHYRQHIPSAFDGPSEPHILIEYVKALRESEGDAAAAAFLDQMMALLADDPLGPAAALLRVSGEPDDVVKDGLIIRFVEEQPGSQLSTTLSPYYLGAKHRQGALHQAFGAIDPDKTLEKAKTSEQRADAIYGVAAAAESAQGELERFPRGKAAQLNLGNVMNPLEACTALAELFYADGKYGNAAEAALGAIRNAPIRIPRLDTDGAVTAIDELGVDDTPYALQTAAALLISRCHEQLGDERSSRKWLREAESIAPDTPVKAYALYLRAKQDAGRGRADSALEKIKGASELVDKSPTLILLAKIAEASRPQPGSGVVVSKRIEETLTRAKTAEPPQSVRAYLEAADLAVQIGQVEQAVTAYQALAEQHAEDEQAAPALASAVRLLESQGRPPSLKRAQALRTIMAERYGEDRVNQLVPESGTQATH